MNKLLVITVLVALLALSAESFRVPRQAEEEQDEGTLSKIAGTVKSYYSSVVDTASGYLDRIRGLKLEEKATNLYTESVSLMRTYGGIVNDQLYHIVYPEQ